MSIAVPGSPRADPITPATRGPRVGGGNAGRTHDWEHRLQLRPSQAPASAEAVPGEDRNIQWQRGRVEAAKRQSLFRAKPFTLWFTGLSGSGKSTLAFALEERLFERGHACYVLDGDNIRHGLNRDLGFTPQARTENIRRIAEVAHLFNDAGMIVLAAFISPYEADRQLARAIIGAERFAPVYLNTGLAVCEARDPKGLYAKARTGKLPDFTGISAPYEPPADAYMILDTGQRSADQCIDALLRNLERDYL